MSENIKTSVKGDTLTITVDLSHRGGVSKSGKTIRVASTEGNIPVDDTQDVKMGINIYVPNR
jgi:hypothetical protein